MIKDWQARDWSLFHTGLIETYLERDRETWMMCKPGRCTAWHILRGGGLSKTIPYRWLRIDRQGVGLWFAQDWTYNIPWERPRNMNDVQAFEMHCMTHSSRWQHTCSIDVTMTTAWDVIKALHGLRKLGNCQCLVGVVYYMYVTRYTVFSAYIMPLLLHDVWFTSCAHCCFTTRETKKGAMVPPALGLCAPSKVYHRM